MTERLHIDWETRSAEDLKAVGMHVYAEHPTTFIWLARFHFESDTGPALVPEDYGWAYWMPFPQRVLDHVANGGIVVAHNAGFERVIWNIVLPRQIGHPVPLMTIEQQDCTMSRALAMGLPAALETVAAIVEAPVQKDMKGAANMKTMARPRKRHEDGTFTWWDDPERIQKLWDYCGDDVLAEEGVDERVPALSHDDLETWRMDQHMNERGIHLDLALIQKAQAVVAIEKKRLDKSMCLLTSGAVQKCSERQKLVDWLAGRGVIVASLAKAAAEDVDDILIGSGDPIATRAVALYREGNKSSTAKLAKMAKTVCADGRSRGTVQCNGAFTGRWAGRLWQPQNLKRMDEDTDGPMIRTAVRVMMDCAPEMARDIIELMHGDVMDALSLCMRSVVCAEEGNVLIGADYSNVEGRIIAWLAGATAKLDAFREQDRGGPDMYKLSYVSSFGGLISEVTKLLRQIGKVQELALGYQGSIGAFINMAANYGAKPEDIASIVLGICSADDMEKARWAIKQPGVSKFGLEDDVWLGLKIVVNNWRSGELNAPISQFWWDLQDAALEAVMDPGVIKNVGKTGLISYIVSNGYMWCRLPTGKVLAYCNPRVRTKVTQRVDSRGNEYDQVQHSVEYDGWDGVKKKWGTIHLYGGLQANHVTQGTAAAIMKRGMKNLEAGRGLWTPEPFVATRAYPNVLTVHDEAMAEMPAFRSLTEEKVSILEFEKLMLDVGNEFVGLPLAAKGWADRRYVK